MFIGAPYFFLILYHINHLFFSSRWMSFYMPELFELYIAYEET